MAFDPQSTLTKGHNLGRSRGAFVGAVYGRLDTVYVLVPGLLLLFSFCLSCGSGPSAEEVDRSMREFQLAATLREEGSLAGAMHHLKRALELDADNARAHLLLGYIHLERRNFPVAERHMRHGIDLLQQQENQGTALAEARNVLGAALIEQRRYDEAIAILREAATDILNTAPYYAWGNLGWAYYKKRQYSQALEAFAEATRTQPRFCLGHFRTGQTHFAQQQFALAEQAFTRALEADARCARNQEAWRLRGETRARLGHREDALADFEHCAELGSTTETGSACMRFLGATQ